MSKLSKNDLPMISNFYVLFALYPKFKKKILSIFFWDSILLDVAGNAGMNRSGPCLQGIHMLMKLKLMDCYF